MEDKEHNNPALKLLRLHLMQVLDAELSDIDKLKSLQKKETKKVLENKKIMLHKQMLKEIGDLIRFSKGKE